MMYGSANQILLEVTERFRPPERIRVSVAAEKYVRVESPGGYHGKWDASITPYMVEPMDTLQSREFSAVVFGGPAQSGKTNGLVDCWIGYAVMCDPGDMGLYFPGEGNGRDYSRRRLNRMHNASPDILARLSRGTHDDNILNKVYKNGMLLDILWPTSSKMAQRNMRFVALSDYDSMPDDVNGEGSPFGVIQKRVQTYMSAGMVMVESSPKHEIKIPNYELSSPHEAPPADGITALFNRGDRRRYYWQCPHCGEWFEGRFDVLRWPDIDNIMEASEQVVAVCKHNGCIIEPGYKKQMNAGGKWLIDGQTITGEGVISGDKRGSTIASFWLNGPAAAFQSWQSLVLKYLQALEDYKRTGSEEALKTTVNVDQGNPYLSKRSRQERTPEEYKERAEDWTMGTVPDGVRFLVATIDVQGNRFEVKITGYGVDRESWAIDRFALLWSDRIAPSGEMEPIDPAHHPEDWRVITEKIIGKRYPLSDDSGRQMEVYFIGIDSGGRKGMTARAYDWWRALKRTGKSRRVRLLKGEGGASSKAPRIRETWPDSTKRAGRKTTSRGDVPVIQINSNVMKDSLFNDLGRHEAGPGFIHFPAWYDDKYYSELVAEKRTEKGWVPVASGVRNEEWDLSYYAEALYLYVRAHEIDWESPPGWAAEWDVNSNVYGASEQEKKKIDHNDFRAI